MRVNTFYLLLFLAASFYFIGLLLIRQDEGVWQSKGIKRDLIIYTDNEGEEHEDEALIELEGIGKVLTYTDLYLSTLLFLIISCILAKVLFNSSDEVRFIIYTNCILGFLLIWLTNKNNVIPTVLYWCGIITASFAYMIEKNHE